MNGNRWLGLAVLACLVAGVSCTFRGPEGIRKDLTQQSGVELEKDFAISVGRTGMWLVKMVNNMANEEDEELPLKGIRKVKVGIYEVAGVREGLDAPRPLQPPRLTGWDNVVRVHEADEDVFVLLREEDERIRGMLIVVAEADEWVVVRVWGKLDQVVEQAMALAFEKGDRPELYDPAVAEYRRRSATTEVASAAR